jgi:hypothetical protein
MAAALCFWDVAKAAVDLEAIESSGGAALKNRRSVENQLENKKPASFSACGFFSIWRKG